ncbi:hypothetical protein [Microbacterium hydrocarbonoxydans]|uniref:hypothetical protein n=1 Tax=Microbacterium hydrocarbonoxydans TaxID=273678 RepID=UPI0013D9D12F|nr:hypothetical protein [Microbacterium hydrocarbonoxydans]
MTTQRQPGRHRTSRRHRRQMNRYYRAPNRKLDALKSIGIVVLVTASVCFLLWAFLIYR